MHIITDIYKSLDFFLEIAHNSRSSFRIGIAEVHLWIVNINLHPLSQVQRKTQFMAYPGPVLIFYWTFKNKFDRNYSRCARSSAG